MLKPFFKKLTAALIIASMLSVSAFADSGVISGSGVNFREGPGTAYKVIATLPKGTVVTVNGLYDSSWYSITYNGQSGFVSSSYLSISSSSDSSAVSTGNSTTASGTQNNGVIIIGQGRIISSAESAAPAATPTSAPSAAVSQNSSNINNGAIIIGGNYSSTVVTPAPAPTASPTAAPTASPAASTSTETAVSGIRTGIISGDYVRFRTGPSTSYSIISTCSKGTELFILDVSGDWTRCTIGGVTGFVSSQYVKETSVSAPAASGSITLVTSTPETASETSTDTVNTAASDQSASVSSVVSTESKAGYISGNNVRFRSSPSLDSEIIGEFYFGNGVTITGTSGDWTAVSVDGKTGYVYSKYIKEGTYTVAAASSTETTAASSASSTYNGQLIAAYACTFVGTPYKWGGTDPSTGFDCSGFVYYVFKQFGINLNRVAADQALNGVAVDSADLQPGDVLCFYSGGSYIGHAGIYIGDGKFVHAASSTTGVIITELAGNYTSRGYVARRMISQ